MAGLRQSSSILLLVCVIVLFASPAHAFGAGYVSKGSSLQGTNFRHGDILNSVYFLTHAHSVLVRQIYFGNWLRDFSQIIDRKTIEVVPEPLLRALVAVFAYTQFGYTTAEFEVTYERLGSYRPEEHIDNPKGYDGGMYTQQRIETNPQELMIEQKTGMKNYIANQSQNQIHDTSLDFIEKQLVAAIACGRAQDAEAYTHLGAALHTLEDFLAHSNYIELCMMMIGFDLADDSELSRGLSGVYSFVGDSVKVSTKRGRAPPLVTGTFGALDLYQTLLGEVDDKVSAMSLPGLRRVSAQYFPESTANESLKRTQDPSESISSISKVLLGLLSKFDGADFESDITKITKSATDQPADWGKLNATPDLLWQQLQPIFRLRDKIVRWVYDHLTISAVANAVASISTALDKLVYRMLGFFLGPILKDISGALQHQSDLLLLKDQHVRMEKGELSIFDDHSNATDPTHSQLCKDHYNHDLNELAGKVATIVTTFTIKKIIEIWQPGTTVDARPTLTSILETLHHPFNYSKESEIQALMVAEVFTWTTAKQKSSPTAFNAFLSRLDKPHMAHKLDEETSRIEHSHVPAMTATYTGANQVSRVTAHDLTTVNTSGAETGLVSKITENLEKSLKKGGLSGLTMDDLPIIKDLLTSPPSADAPNPIDYSLMRIPGANLMTMFDGIDIGEIVAGPGMGILLKDAVIKMRLSDHEWVEKEQALARERLGHLKDRPAKELLKLLDVDPVVKSTDRPVEGETESKARRLLNKLKIGSSKD